MAAPRLLLVDDEAPILESLSAFLTRAGERLLDAVWGWDYPVGTRAVDTRVAKLRRKLDDDAAEPCHIETVTGEGYRFVGSVQAVSSPVM